MSWRRGCHEDGLRNPVWRLHAFDRLVKETLGPRIPVEFNFE
jgi:hypothetical protein